MLLNSGVPGNSHAKSIQPEGERGIQKLHEFIMTANPAQRQHPIAAN